MAYTLGIPHGEEKRFHDNLLILIKLLDKKIVELWTQVIGMHGIHSFSADNPQLTLIHRINNSLQVCKALCIQHAAQLESPDDEDFLRHQNGVRLGVRHIQRLVTELDVAISDEREYVGTYLAQGDHILNGFRRIMQESFCPGPGKMDWYYHSPPSAQIESQFAASITFQIPKRQDWGSLPAESQPLASELSPWPHISRLADLLDKYVSLPQNP